MNACICVCMNACICLCIYLFVCDVQSRRRKSTCGRTKDVRGVLTRRTLDAHKEEMTSCHCGY